MNSVSDKAIDFWIFEPPISSDPLDYNAFMHHHAFRSVFSNLITLYHAGSISGVLADSWEHSGDFLEWRFHIRPGMAFENGDPITSEIIVKSLTRVAFLLNQAGSKAGAFDHLLEIEKVNHPEARFAGLTFTKDEVIFRFKERDETFLESISFGLYATAHPDDYDSKTGIWKDKKKAIASGAYRIQKWDEKSFVLELRDNFQKSLRHPYAISTINFTWDPNKRESSDIVALASITPMPATYFFNGSSPANIAYAYCYSWKEKGNQFSNREFRKKFRHNFYNRLESLGTKITRSFFPLGMAGIQEMVDSAHSNLVVKKQTMSVWNLKTNNKLYSHFTDAIVQAGIENGMEVERRNVDFQRACQARDSQKPSEILDIASLFTGVLIENPHTDIRFMFLSKSGIRLPDEDGSILKELEKKDFSPQRINELLWEQAIIWPIGHFSYGLWTRKEIDVSQLNNSLPPVDFAWVGWAEN